MQPPVGGELGCHTGSPNNPQTAPNKPQTTTNNNDADILCGVPFVGLLLSVFLVFFLCFCCSTLVPYNRFSSRPSPRRPSPYHPPIILRHTNQVTVFVFKLIGAIFLTGGGGRGGGPKL